MQINWLEFVDEMLDVVQELSELQMNKEEKLEFLTVQVAEALEKVDDLVNFLPPGIAVLAKFVIDNGEVDKWQREIIAKPVAEMLYQIWKWVVDALEVAEDSR